ncbi:lysozyme [Streptomyces sp. CB03911]|uniref:lysozyme n=2 Tax=Streptomycetaceae TaxID=2062 RepID=UPI0009A0B857|nr:lysozyme [Streptomyces sp. CB03911]
MHSTSRSARTVSTGTAPLRTAPAPAAPTPTDPTPPAGRDAGAGPRTRRLPRLAAAALAAGALLAGGAAPAQAARPTPVLHPEQDFAGSTVAAHEGRAGLPDARSLAAQTKGMDVSSYQGNVAWSTAAANGARFAYVKATEGTTYTNPYFTQQYNGSYNAGLIRGAYHFALPDVSGGAAQANWFVGHGGGWSGDGKTLPPALDIEYNPYGATCYGLSQSAMVNWIRDFSNTVHSRTGRYPTIYTTTNWWSTCTGNNAGFGATNPLWVARYASSVGTLPAGWSYQTIWQYADSGTLPGDQNWFNGAYDRLQALAKG